VLAKYFIERPVLANVIALLAIVIGAVALLYLPVAQYPPITPPTVQVTARYPGANAQTVVDTVALPIEQQVNGVEKMLYMQSWSANDGTYSLIVTFAVGTDLDQAQVQVQNRIAAAMASLPDAVQALGVVTKKKSTAILQIITLTSPDRSRDSLFLSNYATISLKDTIARIPGVGDTFVFGIGQYSMRVWLDPELMKARSLTPVDVIGAIQQQSQEVAAGQIGAPPAPENQAFQFTLDLRGRFATVAQFEQIAVKTQGTPGGAVTRIRDVGRVELGAQTYSQFLDMDGQPAAGIAVFQLPDANALDVGKAVETEMKRLAAGFPGGIAYSIPFDTTRFVRASISEVYMTLVEAAVLVLLVIVVFLQSWRATLVPATTVPVTIIGAFAAMAALGFGVNLRPRPRHRHRGRRCHHRGRGLGQVCRAGRRAQAGRGARDERIAAADPRHHAGAPLRVPAGIDPAGDRGAALSPVRARHRGDRGDQRDQRDHPEADPMRAVAAAADRPPQRVLSRLQPRL
jgi:hydrophobic/amphiphilic exporter-1 (mainly G- bacteria), HAE1 family